MHVYSFQPVTYSHLEDMKNIPTKTFRHQTGPPPFIYSPPTSLLRNGVVVVCVLESIRTCRFQVILIKCKQFIWSKRRSKKINFTRIDHFNAKISNISPAPIFRSRQLNFSAKHFRTLPSHPNCPGGENKHCFYLFHALRLLILYSEVCPHVRYRQIRRSISTHRHTVIQSASVLTVSNTIGQKLRRLWVYHGQCLWVGHGVRMPSRRWFFDYRCFQDESSREQTNSSSFPIVCLQSRHVWPARPPAMLSD